MGSTARKRTRRNDRSLILKTMLPIFLVVQGGVFLVWTVLAFRWLFALRADAVAISGRDIPSLTATLTAFRGGLVEPRYQRFRGVMAVLTACLLALSAFSFFVVK